MRFVFPYPPSANRAWRKGKGNTYLARAVRTYRLKVRLAVREAVGTPEPLTGELRVRVEVYLPDRRRRDVDNLIKTIGDALQASGLFEDDRQIASWEVRRRGVEPPGRVEVEVEEADG